MRIILYNHCAFRLIGLLVIGAMNYMHVVCTINNNGDCLGNGLCMGVNILEYNDWIIRGF